MRKAFTFCLLALLTLGASAQVTKNVTQTNNNSKQTTKNVTPTNNNSNQTTKNVTPATNNSNQPTKNVTPASNNASKASNSSTQSSDNPVSNAMDKSFFRFHWGFNNWGGDPFSGLTGMSDKAYDLRTSFSSYQLSLGYNFVNTEHFELGVGIGYESDVYKWNTGCVKYSSTNNAFEAVSTNGSGYKTKLCTRYVTLPIGLAWRTAESKGFLVRLSAIPGLGYCGKHTGLKNTTPDEKTSINIKDALNPYKMDVRLDLEFSGFGVFLQVSTMSMMSESFEKELYPIKFGIVI